MMLHRWTLSGQEAPSFLQLFLTLKWEQNQVLPFDLAHFTLWLFSVQVPIFMVTGVAVLLAPLPAPFWPFWPLPLPFLPVLPCPFGRPFSVPFRQSRAVLDVEFQADGISAFQCLPCAG